MRVAFLTWRDSTHPDGGGSEVYVEEVASELVRRGHEVTVLCAAHGTAPTTQTVRGVRLLRRGGRLTVYPRGLIWTIRNRRRVDVVVDVINGLPFWTPFVRRHGVVALVHHVHKSQWHIIYPGLRGRLGWFVEGTIVPRVYRGVPHLTVSGASRADLIDMGIPQNTITVAKNGLRVHSIGADRSADARLCVLGRLVPHKQVEHALCLVRDLRSTFPALMLDVVGDGWWRARLVQQAAELGVQEQVHFHGRVSDPERDRLLAQAWLMVMPSVKEGWGLAVMEAAGQGTPAVAYHGAGGVTESIIDEETGVIVDDYPQLLQAVRTLLANGRRREALGAKARARASDFSWSATTDVVEKVIERAAQRSP
jgi:glycosyltransferase involved in cell wall biosynthesis